MMMSAVHLFAAAVGMTPRAAALKTSTGEAIANAFPSSQGEPSVPNTTAPRRPLAA